ncbi:MAG: prepilin peptidase [Halanaeroarchaeum sp.]
MVSSIVDLLRLVAVPVLGWAAYRDVLTRRVPNDVWWPLALLGVGLLAWEGWGVWGTPWATLWLLRVGLSIGLVVPLAYVFWRIGGFGGADAKAFMVLAVLFPTYPTVRVAGLLLPLHPTDVGVFSLTILTNTVLVGLAYPLALGVRNLLAGEWSPVMFLGRTVSVERLPDLHGSLMETPDGLTRNGLDLDALRMYLRWRGCSLAAIREDPSLRDPATLPSQPNDPTDGAVRADGSGDPWGAEAFLADIDSDAYGTTPEQLRAGLDVLVARDEVWITPGVPFIVPTFVGLLVALTVGDLMFLALGTLGLV